MASVINTNIASLYAQKNLSGAQSALSTAVERLSSGLRINRAKDDAAGLGISENIKQQINSVNQGIRNANDAISMVQTAEGSLSEVSSILQRMKELSVQARNDSLSTVQRTYISDELVALKNEINSIAERTTFNDISLAKNGLRTAISQTFNASNAFKNGASMLDGLTVSNLTANTANQGTYTISTGTQTVVANQISTTDSALGQTQQLKQITIGGVWNVGDKITATVEIQGGARVSTEYYVTAGDIEAGDPLEASGSASTLDANDVATHQSIAQNLAAAIEKKAMDTTGAGLGIAVNGSVVSINNTLRDNALAVTTVVDSRIQRTGTSVATAAVTNGTAAAQTRVITIAEEDAVEGNRFVLNVGGREYSVVASSTASSANPPTATDIRNQVATDLANLLAADYPGAGVVQHLDRNGSTSGTDNDTGIIQIAAGAGLGDAAISLTVKSLTDGSDVRNIATTVTAPSTTTNAAARVIDFNSFDIVAGRKVSVEIEGTTGKNTFSLVMRNSDTDVTVATRMKTLIDAVYGSTTTANGEVTIAAAANLGQVNIRVSMSDMVDAGTVDSQSSVTKRFGEEHSRLIRLNQADLTVGRVVSLQVDGKEYATKVLASDTVNDVATRLVGMMDDNLTRKVGTVVAPTVDTNVTSTVKGVMTLTFGAMTAGEVITVDSLTFTATTALAGSQVAAAFANLADGATRGDSTGGTFSGDLSGWRSGAVSTATVAFTQTVANETPTSATFVTGANEGSVVTAANTVVTTAAAEATAAETADLTFSAMTAGDSLTINGLTFTANRDITAAEAATAFSSMTASADATGAGIAYGTYTGEFATGSWTTGSATGATITATYVGASATSADPANIDTTIRAQRVDSGVYVADRGQAEWNVTFKALAADQSVEFNDGDGTSVRFTAKRAMTAEEVAAAFTGVYDGFDAADVANGINGGYTVSAAGTTAGLQAWKTAVVDGATIKFTATGTGTTAPTLSGSSGTGTTPTAVSVNDEATIVFGSGSMMGRKDISVVVKDITDPGKITLTANADTGIGGTSQSIDMGTIAAGSSKQFDFDKLGFRFVLNNTSADAMSGDNFSVYSPQASTLKVDATGGGAASFQVGAATRDVVSVDGFKDIRITGYNKNSGEEASVFDRLYATLNTIAANTTESLSSENFATLENQIEDVITTVADFRSYFGAQQNRIEFAISNLQAQAENLTAANSRIRDTDYAAETANLTKTQIMQQAATAMLAQANQMPNVILALLK